MTTENFNVWGPLAFGVYAAGIYGAFLLVDWWDRRRFARTKSAAPSATPREG